MLKLPAFLRRFIRRHTKSKNPRDALTIRRNISIGYAFITWNLMGFLAYSFYKKSADKSNPSNKNLQGGRYYADLLEQDNVILKRYKLGSKVGEWDLEEEKKQFGRLLTEEELEASKEGLLTREYLEQKYKIREDMQDLEEGYLKK